MPHKLGMDCKFYYSSSLLTGEAGGEPGDLTWNEIANVKDLTLNMEKGEADVTTRANNGFRATLATLKEGTIEFEMMWDPTDAAFTALKNAYFANTDIALAAMDGAIGTSGSQGLVSNFQVLNFSRAEPLEEGVTVSVSVKPHEHTEWYEVA